MSFIAVGAIAAPALIQSNAASSANQKQQAATQQANQVMQGVYDQSKKDYAPWQQAGTSALSQMQDPNFQKNFSASDFTKDPGYDFRMQEGQKALERSAAARGGLQSGGMAKALDRYGQGFASNEYQNAYNRFNNDQSQRFGRLSQIAGYGMNANSALGAAGQNYGNLTASNIMNAGNAAGAADIASGNAWAGAINKPLDLGAQFAGMAMGGGKK